MINKCADELVTAPPGWVRSITMSMSACLSVCPLAHLKKPHAQISQNLLYMLHVAVARSFSDDIAISYVLPVLWMTSYFHIMVPLGQN